MEYKGKLYGKVGKIYFPLEATADDFDNLTIQNKELESKLSEANKQIRLLEKSIEQREITEQEQWKEIERLKSEVDKMYKCPYCGYEHN